MKRREALKAMIVLTLPAGYALPAAYAADDVVDGPEWPYLISLATTETVNEYEQIRPILAAAKGPVKQVLAGKAGKEVAEVLQALPGKFNFDRIMENSLRAIRMSDEVLLAGLARETEVYEREFAAVRETSDMGWFDLMLERENLAVTVTALKNEAVHRKLIVR